MNDDIIITAIKDLRKDMTANFEKTTEKLHQTNIILSVQKEQLKEHMRRSDALELGQKLLKQEFENRTDKLEDVIAPIQRHVSFVESGFKWAGVVASIVAFAVTLKTLGVF
jgi:hypothetical protein